MVARGEFREDLFYRINTIEVPLPPLRDRGDDVPLLAHHFLDRYARKYRKNVTGISASALSKLGRYHWPGNVRELQHAIERAVILSGSEALAPQDFLFPVATRKSNQLPLDAAPRCTASWGVMILRGFRLTCTLRVFLLVVTTVAFAWSLSTGRYATLLVLAALIVFQTWSLIRYVQYTNRSLDQFLTSIKFSDFSQKPTPGPAGKSFANLAAILDEVSRKFQEISTTREESARYLHSVVQHVGIGLIAFDETGKVELHNSAAKALLDVAVLRNVDDLAPASPELHEKIKVLGPGQRDMVTVPVQGQLMQLSLHATQLRRQAQTITIVSIQNISAELNEKEMEAWRNLIRVLTHEIKNSLTPIASLAASVEDAVIPTTAAVPQVREALQIIQKRSEGLLEFVDAYRDLTHVPEPDYQMLKIANLFARIEQLVAPQIEGRSVRFRTAVRPDTMTLTADPRLIEQVLINLLLNALQATEGQSEAEIALEARIDARNHPIIEVTDNGPGIVGESLDKIFVPFYSTRKEGSGIGLSLSRQMMRMHRGDLTVRSDPGVKTVFALRF
jgi:signal transduction histidine kinase